MLLVVLGLLGLPRTATAEIPQTVDGPGIKIGPRSTLHPGFAVIFGGDSNVFWTDPQDRGGVRGSVMMMPTAWVGLGNRKVRDRVLQSPSEASDRKVDYNLRASGGYRAYLSGDRDLRGQSRFNLTVDGHLLFAPGRRFSVALDESFARLAEPRNYAAGPEFNFNRIDHRGALTLLFRPGGGNLSLSLGYLNEILYYEAADIANADRVINGVATEAKWRLRPRSSLLIRYSFLYTYYLCCAEAGSGRNEDSFAHQVLAGYRGRFAKRLVAEALVGYGHADYIYDNATPANFRGIVGHLNFTYFPTPRTNLFLRLERSYHDSLFGNYFTDLGGRVGAAHTFPWRMFTALQLAAFARRYEGLPVPGQDTATITGYENVYGDFATSLARKDAIVALESRIEQPLGRLFVVGLRYNLVVESSDFVTRFANGFLDYAGFVKHVVMGVGAVRF